MPRRPPGLAPLKISTGNVKSDVENFNENKDERVRRGDSLDLKREEKEKLFEEAAAYLGEENLDPSNLPQSLFKGGENT